MHVVQPEKDLLRYLPNEVHGNAFILMTLDKTEKVFAEDFEDHADVRSIWTAVTKVIEKGDDMFST